MFCVSLPTRTLGLCGLGLIAAFAGAIPADAADIYGDEGPPPYVRRYDPPPVYRDYYPPPPPVVRREVAPCHIIHRRGWDVDGREIVRRLRVCEEGVVASRDDWAVRRHYEYGAPRYGYDGPRYEAVPRPPRPVGSDYRRPDYDGEPD